MGRHQAEGIVRALGDPQGFQAHRDTVGESAHLRERRREPAAGVDREYGGFAEPLELQLTLEKVRYGLECVDRVRVRAELPVDHAELVGGPNLEPTVAEGTPDRTSALAGVTSAVTVADLAQE